jgi:AmmeMemoRadiSam system protein B
MRQPIVDGQFYEANPKALIKQIESCFKDNLGPGSLPSKKSRKKNIIGVICPHAGYMFSGNCQAFSYKELAEAKAPELYILFGLSHNGFESCISIEDWKTPLGVLKNDREFGDLLSKISGLPIDELPHQNEHSIEVQLPFLQFVNKEKNFKILPIIISPDINLKEFAKNLKKVIDQTNKTAILIASSDFIHYGYNYGFAPFKDNIKENMCRLDSGAIEKIKNMDSEGFLSYIKKTGATICGQYPVAALIEAAKLLGAKKAELLKYYTSAEISGDYSNSVGYASVIIK